MYNNKDKLKKLDMLFIVFLGIVIISLIIASLIIYSNNNNDYVKSTNTPTPTAIPTSHPIVIPSVSPTKEPDKETIGGLKYELPRKASISLNPNLKYDLIIGGTGSDTLQQVISLENTYLFGTTNSKDFDFQSNQNVDCFMSVVNEKGTLIKNICFGTTGDDYIVSAKPLLKKSSTEQNTMLAIVQNVESSDTLYIYKIYEESLAISSTKVVIGNNLKVSKAISQGDKITFIATTTDGEETISHIISVDSDMRIRKIKTMPNYKFVDFVAYNEKYTVLANNKDSQMSMISINADDGETNIISYSDFKATANQFIPTPDGGFLIEYNLIIEGVNKSGLFKVDKSLSKTFNHMLEGEKYQEIKIIFDMGKTDLKGYHIFASKEVNGKFSTYYENICIHGDVVDRMIEVAEDFSIKKVITSDDNFALLGEAIKNDTIDVAIIGVDKAMNELFKRTYGGNGNDVLVSGIQNYNGDMLLFCNTTSTNGDITTAFGKSDVLVLCPTENK